MHDEASGSRNNTNGPFLLRFSDETTPAPGARLGSGAQALCSWVAFLLKAQRSLRLCLFTVDCVQFVAAVRVAARKGVYVRILMQAKQGDFGSDIPGPWQSESLIEVRAASISGAQRDGGSSTLRSVSLILAPSLRKAPGKSWSPEGAGVIS